MVNLRVACCPSGFPRGFCEIQIAVELMNELGMRQIESYLFSRLMG